MGFLLRYAAKNKYSPQFMKEETEAQRDSAYMPPNISHMPSEGKNKRASELGYLRILVQHRDC